MEDYVPVKDSVALNSECNLKANTFTDFRKAMRYSGLPYHVIRCVISCHIKWGLDLRYAKYAVCACSYVEGIMR